MTELIVDFPSHHRRHPGRRAKCARRPSVRFAPEREIRVYPAAADDGASSASDLHYADADYKKFRLAKRQDVLDAHRRLARAAGGDDASAACAGCELTGLETLLSPKIIRTAVAKRRECLNAVLDEQDRQFAEGCHDPELLACVSRTKSRWATQRAMKVGLMHQLI